MTRLLAALLIGALTLLPTSVIGGSPRILQSLDILSVETPYGSGTCSTSSVGHKTWLTAAHCVSDLGAVTIGGQLAFPYVIDIENDLALLVAPFNSKPALRLAKKAPDYGDRVYIAGYPRGIGPLVVSGEVASPAVAWPIFGLRMTLSSSGCQGNSGSPITNTQNELVSVLQLGMDAPCSPLMGGSTFQVLKMFLEKYLQ